MSGHSKLHLTSVDDAPEEAPVKAELCNTQLVAWFKLNSNPATRSPYLYPETPVHYVWSKNEWHKREIYTKTIGQMYKFHHLIRSGIIHGYYYCM